MTSRADTSVWAAGLSRTFGRKTAVRGLDLEVGPGEFYGLLGPNGAGKTTTIRMIVGLLRPTRGTSGIGRWDTWANPIEVKRRIGVLPEEFNLYDRLTGHELLAFVGAAHRLPRSEGARRSSELLEVLDLGEAANELIADYSRGMRKKIALAAAVIHAPPVLFLDEPFEGVDAVSARMIKRLLQQFTESGATVIFSSHVMELVEKLCTRIGVMNHGELIADATPEQLRVAHGVDSIEEAFLAAVGAEESERDLSWLRASSG